MTTKPRIETIHIWMLMTIPLMIGVLAAASTQEDPQGAGFLETVKVNLVEIDVVVTDRDGNPVGGLTVEDFQLSEDGRKVKLTHFRAGQGGLPGGGAMDPELTAAPSPPSYVVLLIDNFAIHPANRARVASGLEDYLARELDGDTWFAIASYDGYLNMRQTFTQDRALLQEAVGGLEEISALGTLRMVERQATFRAGLETLRSIEALVGDPTRGESVPRRLATFSRQINAQAEEIR